jgi:hypothetical protein
MDTETTKYMWVEGKYYPSENFYRFIIPKDNIVTLHNVWLEDETCVIKNAMFIGADLCHESLDEFAIEMCKKDRNIPFFFTRAHGGFPMVSTPYYTMVVDLWLKESRDNTIPLKMGMHVSLELDPSKFDKLQQQHLLPHVVTYPNMVCTQGKLFDNCFETNITTSDKVLAIVSRVKDVDGNYISVRDLVVDYYFDYNLKSIAYGYEISPDENDYIIVKSFVPDAQNPPDSKKPSLKDMSLRLEFHCDRIIDSIELLCVRHQAINFSGGVGCFSLGQLDD